MFGYQQRKVGVLCLMFFIFVAVAVYGDNAVGVLIYHNAVGVHTEGPYIVLEFLRPVDNLALIQFISQMRENYGRKFYPDSDVYPVRACRNL